MSAPAPAPLAVVTGASGFLGLYLVEALRAAGWRVRALHRATSNVEPLRQLGAELVRTDILERDGMHAAVGPDARAVFHTAADLNVWRPRDAQQTRTNVEGTANVVAATLAAQGPLLVHVSTIAAYGAQDAPVTESTPSNAATSWINYERSKWLAAEEVRRGARAGLPAIIMVPAAMVGPRDRTGWAKMFIELAHGRVPFCPPGSGTFNDVRAASAAIVAAATRGRPGESYLLSGETLRFTTLIKIVAEQLGRPAPRITLPRGVMRPLVALADWQATRRGVEPDMTREMADLLCRDTICGSHKAEEELGYQPTSVRTALGDSVNWLRKEGLL